MHRPHPPLSGFVVLVALALAALGAPAVALAAPPTPGPPPARATPTAGPPPAPAFPGRGATPRPPAHDRPGALAGVRYDPARDTVGAGDTVGRYRDEQVRNGVPGGDADRIALAHYTYDCQQTGDCARTGLDLSGVDVNDAHANFGYHPECQAWGVDFLPWWGVWSPPDGQPTCAGGGGGGGVDSGGGFGLPTPGSLARAVLGALDWKILLVGFVNGLWNLVVGDGFEHDAGQIAGLLLVNPNLTGGGTPQMRTIQALVDDLRAAGVGLALLVLTVQVLEAMAGAGAGLGGVVVRATVVVAALGFYPLLVGELLGAIDALTRGILTAGGDTVSAEFGGILRSLSLLTIPFWRLIALTGFVFIVAIGVVKVIGLVLLLLLYAAGPVLLPLAIHPQGAGWVGTWAEHFVKILIWPALFAFEFRVFGALGAGISFTGAQGNIDLVQGGLGVIVALASLLVILVTPWGCHTQFTAARAIQIVRDHRRAATAGGPGRGRGRAAGRDERSGTIRGLVGDTAAAATTPPNRTLRRVK